ncbi:MAG TPA: hypothetical protein VGL94_20090 [Ktedonobacteraceae bacterium]
MLLSTGFKTTASHEIINAAYDQLGAHQEQLGKLIGEQEAARVVIIALGGTEKRLADQSYPDILDRSAFSR